MKSNLEKFSERFFWILAAEEENNLRSKISTSKDGARKEYIIFFMI